MTQIFGGTQGQDDTNAILADDKIGIEYRYPRVPAYPMPSLLSNWFGIGYSMSTQISNPISVSAKNHRQRSLCWKQPILQRILPNLSPMPADGKVGIGYPRISVPDAILIIKSVRYQVSDANSNIVSSSAAICHRGSWPNCISFRLWILNEYLEKAGIILRLQLRVTMCSVKLGVKGP